MEDSMAFFKHTSLKQCPPNLILLPLCFHSKPIIRFHVAAILENISHLECLFWLTLIPKIVGPISKGKCCQISDFCHNFYYAFMQNLRFQYYLAAILEKKSAILNFALADIIILEIARPKEHFTSICTMVSIKMGKKLGTIWRPYWERNPPF